MLRETELSLSGVFENGDWKVLRKRATFLTSDEVRFGRVEVAVKPMCYDSTHGMLLAPVSVDSMNQFKDI